MAQTLHTPVGAAPVLVYTPATVGTPVGELFNEGTSPVWIGRAGVTVNSGILLNPGDRHRTVGATQSWFAVSNYSATTTAGTTIAALNAGAGTITFGAGVAFGGGTGSTIVIGSSATSADSEVVTFLTGTGGSVITFTPTNYDHRSGAIVTVVNALGSAVHTESATG